MKQTLVIGSTAVDVIINIDHLPSKSCDVNIKTQKLATGGCAFNMSEVLRLFNIPYTLCSPVGTGIYGAFVEKQFLERSIPVFKRVPDIDNGCCYCLVEGDGERTFLSQHGAEYLFNKSWMSNIDFSTVDSVYISGLEVEDPTGIEIVEFLEEHSDLKIFFATGPRICCIAHDRLERIFALHPILHLNEKEALEYTGIGSDSLDSVQLKSNKISSKENNDGGSYYSKYLDEGVIDATLFDEEFIDSSSESISLHKRVALVARAAEKLNALTNNDVIITMGRYGAYCYSKEARSTYETKQFSGTTRFMVRGYPVTPVNTIGAGDAHIGAIVAGLKSGLPLKEAVDKANRVSAAVVGVTSATLSTEQFAALKIY